MQTGNAYVVMDYIKQVVLVDKLYRLAQLGVYYNNLPNHRKRVIGPLWWQLVECKWGLVLKQENLEL